MRRRILVKKVAALLLALSVVLSLAACGGTKTGDNSNVSNPAAPGDTGSKVDPGSNSSTSGTTDKDVYIDLYGVWNADNAKGVWLADKGAEFAAEYEAENGISVDFVYVPQAGYDGVAEKLTAGSVSKELPVIAQMEESFLFQFHPLCADLEQYLSEDVINNYLDGLKVSCMYDGKLLAVPAGRSYTCIYVNEKLLADSGHTDADLKDWDGLREVAKDIAALGDDIEGFGVYWDTDAWMWETMLYANGGSVCTDDGKTVTFAEDDAGAVYLAQVKDMLLEGSAISFYGQTDKPLDALYDLFLQGKLGILFSSITSYGTMKTAQSSGEYGELDVHVLDQPAGRGGNSVVTGGSNFIICNTATETQKKVAAAFLEYLAEDKNCAEWNELSTYLAFTKSVYDSEYYAKNAEDPNLIQIAEGIQYAHARPQTKHWREMYTYIVDYLEDFSMNPEKYDPVQLNRDLATACQNIIDNG